MSKEDYVTREELEANNPVNMLRSGWFLVAAGLSLVWFVAGVDSSVKGNTASIQDIESSIDQIEESVEKIPSVIIEGLSDDFAYLKAEDEEQNERFSLYLDSLRNLNSDVDVRIKEFEARVAETERDILIIQNEIGN